MKASNNAVNNTYILFLTYDYADLSKAAPFSSLFLWRNETLRRNR